MAGIVMLAIDAGAGLELPSSTFLPALALALGMGLEAALLNKFLASVMLQKEITQNKKKPQKTGSWNQMLWHTADIASFIAMSDLAW